MLQCHPAWLYSLKFLQTSSCVSLPIVTASKTVDVMKYRMSSKATKKKKKVLSCEI